MLGRRRDTGANGAPPPAAPQQHKRLGDLLLAEGIVTAGQLDEAVAVQKKEGGFIGQILIRLGYVTQDGVASCLVKQCKIPHLSLLDYDISPDVVRLIPEEICRKYNLLPIDKLGRILTLAMVDPLDIEALEAVRKAYPDLRVKPILCNWDHFDLVAGKVLGQKKTTSGKAEVTAQSLGLRASPAAQKAGPAAAPAAPVAAEKKPAAPAPAPAPAGVSHEQVASAMRDSLQDALSPLGDTVRQVSEQSAMVAKALSEQSAMVAKALTERPRAPEDRPNTEELAAIVRDGVGGALQETMASLMVQMRAAPVERGTPSAEDLSQIISESISGSMRESMALLAAQMDSRPPGDRPPEPMPMPAPEELAATIRDSVGGAMEEAIASLAVQMRADTNKKDLSDVALAEMMRETRAEMSQAIRETLDANREAQAGQNDRLAAVAEAVLQSVQQAAVMIEESKASGSDMQNVPAQRQRRVAGNWSSVTSFEELKAAKDEDAGAAEDTEQADERVMESLESERPMDAMVFDNFFPGEVNAFSFKLAQGVAAKPGSEYNPFFLYGNVGVGKTHLITAMGNAIHEHNAEVRVGYVSASHFSRRLTEALQDQAADAFREAYCHWDVLILDDIQFMGGRVEAQEEFFHIFNVLHQERRQIIIASDKAPDGLGMLEKRLVSRFSSGIVAELKAPEWETRMDILRDSVGRSGAAVPESVLSLIAMRVPNDIRKMTGALRKIVAYADLVGQELSCEMADEILSHLNMGAAA